MPHAEEARELQHLEKGFWAEDVEDLVDGCLGVWSGLCFSVLCGLILLFYPCNRHPSLGWEATAAYLSLPIILVVTQSISQKLLQPPASDDPAQQQTQQILKFLPLMIGWFALNVPAGLGVYWVINNGLSTLQQWYIRQQFKVDEPEPAMAGGGAPMKFQDEVMQSTRHRAFGSFPHLSLSEHLLVSYHPLGFLRVCLTPA